MQDTSKYLIHADITADGVVERSDVVGAIFGQTEGLLGDDLDLRGLQESSKVGRIDVEIDSENGQSFGTVTIASGLDKVETAILAASLETIDRIGPCRAKLAVADIEDVRTAKRREVVERAKTLLAEAFEGQMSSADIVSEVRRSVRVEDVTDYEGLPAGPRVADSDAVVVVEGRADVLTLLEYGVKNAVAVEGTNVPDAVADLTADRTVTAFLDGDRGGDLILKELAQVGDVDYVALAPPDRSVENMDRREVIGALREKVPYEAVAGADGPGIDEVAATDGSTRPAPEPAGAGPETPGTDPGGPGERPAAGPDADEGAGDPGVATEDETAGTVEADPGKRSTGGDADRDADGRSAERPDPADPDASDGRSPPAADPETLRGHVAAVVGGETGTVRLLDQDLAVLSEAPADGAFEAVRDADPVPATVVLDGQLDQRVLDVAAQRGVGQVVPREEGEYVKKPAAVRVRPAASLLGDPDE